MIVTEARLIPDLVRKGVVDATITTSPELKRQLHDAKLVRLEQSIGYDVTVLLSASPSPRPNADWFVQWIMSYRGRDAIQRYRYGGGSPIHPMYIAPARP